MKSFLSHGILCALSSTVNLFNQVYFHNLYETIKLQANAHKKL